MITEKQVLEALQENMLYEFENGGHRYNLYIANNGQIVDDINKADESFYTYADYALTEDEKNPDLMEVVENLAEQANEYLKEYLNA